VAHPSVLNKLATCARLAGNNQGNIVGVPITGGGLLVVLSTERSLYIVIVETTNHDIGIANKRYTGENPINAAAF